MRLMICQLIYTAIYPTVGLEPTKPKGIDFKSTVSTNSTKWGDNISIKLPPLLLIGFEPMTFPL